MFTRFRRVFLSLGSIAIVVFAVLFVFGAFNTVYTVQVTFNDGKVISYYLAEDVYTYKTYLKVKLENGYDVHRTETVKNWGVRYRD